MYRENVVDLPGRLAAREAKEYALLLRLEGEDVQFKLFSGEIDLRDRHRVAQALEVAAKRLREPE